MRQTREYETVKMLYGDTDNDYSIRELCDALQITQSAYYHWLNGAKSQRELTNDRLAQRESWKSMSSIPTRDTAAYVMT